MGIIREGQYIFLIHLTTYIKKKHEIKGRIHDLRHTYGSNLVSNGVSLYIVAKLMGHSDIKATEIYAHLAPSATKQAVQVLNGIVRD